MKKKVIFLPLLLTEEYFYTYISIFVYSLANERKGNVLQSYLAKNIWILDNIEELKSVASRRSLKKAEERNEIYNVQNILLNSISCSEITSTIKVFLIAQFLITNSKIMGATKCILKIIINWYQYLIPIAIHASLFSVFLIFAYLKIPMICTALTFAYPLRLVLL